MLCAFICCEQIIQDLLAHAGIIIHHFAILEGEMEVVHKLPAYGKRHGGAQGAVHPVRVRHAEDFFGRNIGKKAIACGTEARAAFPDVILHKSDHQVSARTLVVHTVKACVIKEFAMGFEFVIVLFPGSHRIFLVDACRHKNVLPQFLHGFFFRHSRKGCFSPGWAGNGNDAPLHLVLHGVLHGPLAGHAGDLLPLGNPRGVSRLEQIRVGRMHAENVMVVQEEIFGKIHQVFRVGFKAFRRGFQKAVERNRVVVEHQLDIAHTSLISLFCDQAS